MEICVKHEVEKVPRASDGMLVCGLCRWELLQDFKAKLKEIQYQVDKEIGAEAGIQPSKSEEKGGAS